MPPRFHWTTFDVTDLLPEHWQQDVAGTVPSADFREFPRTPILSREAAHVPHISRGRVHASQVRSILPWLHRSYRGVFLDLAQEACAEQVVAHDPAAADIESVERSCSVIRPHAGHLIFFDARRHPHYARPLAVESDVRIVAVMNFYTASFPESTRPAGLNRHLYGTD